MIDVGYDVVSDFLTGCGRCDVVDGKPFIFLGAVAVVAFDGVLREVFDGIIAELGLLLGFAEDLMVSISFLVGKI